MKKLNLLTMVMLAFGFFLMSCAKDDLADENDDFGLIGTTGEIVESPPCWDLNENGVKDKEEDKNKDGIVDSSDCAQP